MVSPLHSVNSNPTAMLSHVTAEHESMGSGQQTRTSPPIPVKTMLLEALIPSQTVQTSQTLAEIAGTTSVSPATTVEQTGESLLTTINAALLPQLPETQVSATTATSNATVFHIRKQKRYKRLKKKVSSKNLESKNYNLESQKDV